MTPEPAGDRSRWEGRRRAREAALRMLYQSEVGRAPMADAVVNQSAIGGTDAIPLDDEAREFAVALAGGAWQDRQALDQLVADAAHNWRVERLAVIDRLLLRLAIHELLAHPGTPHPVVIDEAIELARAYSGEDAAKFVNGILDAVFKRLKKEGRVS